MIPNDVKTVFPKLYVDADEEGMQALADVLNDVVAAIKVDAMGIASLHDGVRVPVSCLEELGYYVAADIYSSNTEAEKRAKTAKAVRAHKNRGLWIDDLKPKIDLFCGGDSQLFNYVGYDDWVCCGKGNEPSAYYWSGCGGKDAGLDYGILVYGKGTEPGVKGNVFIDVDNSGLSAAEVEELKLELSDSVASYMRYFLGYVVGAVLTVYANGIINE